MAEGRNDRIDKLSQRFHRHTAGRPPATTPRRRERHSFYLDGELTQRIDATYREVAHQLHPQTVSKSVFLETLLEFGLDRLPDLTTVLQKKTQT
jgi:hypothetical protein